LENKRVQVDETWLIFYIFHGPDSKQTADTTVRTMRALYSNAGSPKDVYVYHRRNQDGDYIYFLSPAASVVYKEILDLFGPIKVTQPPMGKMSVLIPDEPVKGSGFGWNWQPA
jgi:hypothetical protein